MGGVSTGGRVLMKRRNCTYKGKKLLKRREALLYLITKGGDDRNYITCISY